MQDNNLDEKLCLEARKSLALTCVNSVDGYNENNLKLTVNGTKVSIVGNKLKIASFSKTSGSLTATGEITEIKYGGTKTSFFKRIFK